MAHKLPEPGYYTSNGKDVIVLDPATLSHTGKIRTKDGDAANWRAAVAFQPAFEPGDLCILSVDVFDDRFKPTTREECLKRVQDAEAKASLDAARDAEADESVDGEAQAEGVTNSATS